MVRTFQKSIRKTSKKHKKKCRKSDAKNIGKSSTKSSNFDAKTINKPSKNRFKKKVEKQRSGPTICRQARGGLGSGKKNNLPTERQQKEDNLKERSSERSMQRDKPRPSNTPRAPSGPERIYWALGPPGPGAESGLGLRNRAPPSQCPGPRAPFFGIQARSSGPCGSTW